MISINDLGGLLARICDKPTTYMVRERQRMMKMNAMDMQR